MLNIVDGLDVITNEEDILGISLFTNGFIYLLVTSTAKTAMFGQQLICEIKDTPLHENG